LPPTAKAAGPARLRLFAPLASAAAVALIPLITSVAAAQSSPQPAPPSPSTTPATGSPTSAATTPSSTISDPAAVLRAANVPQAERDEAARRLLMRQTPEARKQIIAALGDASNRGAQLAAARAVPLDPAPDQAFINPLFQLIGPQPTLTDAAIQALATFRTQADVMNYLVRLAADPRHEQPRETTRASAIRAVGTMPNKPAARVLMDILTNDAEPASLRNAAAGALSEMTGAGVMRTDPAYWQKWWAENQNKQDADFEHDMLGARNARLVRLQNRFDRFVVEARTLMEENYQAAPDKNKEPILLRYLRSTEPETRSLGAKIVQDDFKQTRPITPAVRDQLRGMVADPTSSVRIAVAQALLLLNDAQALDALLAQLAQEPDPDVRMELARALVPMRDVRVVQPLLKLLRDPSPAVAEVAARGLGSDDLAPLIRKDQPRANDVTVELNRALNRPGAPASLRAAIIDAMGALRQANLRTVYTGLLNGREPVPVRRAALRALGQFGKPNNGENWPAAAIVDSLSDPDDSVRQEAVRAMKTTADFSHAERIYELCKRDSQEPSQSVRDEAWGVLRNLFSDPAATMGQLISFADRFKGDPERRIDVLKVVAERLTPLNDERNQDLLASQRQNLGAEYMELARRAEKRTDLDAAAREQAVMENAKQADKYFDLALQHYRAKDPTDQGMATSNLLELRMDALLASKQYAPAADFAASSIAANPGNQEAMGRKINTEAGRLSRDEKFDDALRLIEATKTMNPPLEGRPASSIAGMEAGIRQKIQSQQQSTPSTDAPTSPRSAAGT